MRPEKSILVKHIQSILDESGNFLVVSYMGLSVKKIEELKSLLKEENALFQVHKNQLIKKAAIDKPYSELSNTELVGGTAIVIGEGEVSGWAKVIKKFAKENEEVSFKAAFLEGEVLDAKAAAQVAELPTKDQARAMLLSALMSGPTQLAGILRTSYSSVATVIKNYTDKNEA